MPIKRLSPLDASFLAVESPTAHMHIGWAAIFEPPSDRRSPSFEELRDHIESRLPRAPRFRQVLRTVPFGLNAPVWLDDQRFDIDRHVVQAGTGRLGEVIDWCVSAPLPRDRPLWQICIADRLDDGRIGIVGKAHHCMADGVAAVELGSVLLDPDPDPPAPARDRWEPRPQPRRRDLIATAVADLARRQLALAALPLRLARSPGRIGDLGARGQRAAAALVRAARPARPAPELNPPISPLRHLGLLGRPLEDLLRIKEAFGVTLNDVVLAASAGGVRQFLRELGGEPTRLKTMIPVNVRAPGEEGELGNQISFMFVDLPCDEPDPVRRLREIHATTSERKRTGDPEAANDVVRALDFVLTPLQRVVSRVIASPRTFNLVISNIPGPEGRLYMRGCRLVEAYPVVPLADRHALSIGVTTVGDGAFFGLYVDRRSLPDADLLAAEIDAAIDGLLERIPERADSREPLFA